MKLKVSLITSIILIIMPFAVSAVPITWDNNGHQYELISFSGTWEQARTDAESRGGHLATVTSAEENSFIFNNVYDSSVSSWVWLGATDQANEGVWQWITDETFNYENWGRREPNNSGNEDFLMMWGNGTWNDLGGRALGGYVFENSTQVALPSTLLLMAVGLLAMRIRRKQA